MKHNVIYQRMEKIRNLLNNKRKYSFFQTHIPWNKFCCAMDVIEDTDMAIEGYCRGRAARNYSEKYLRLYGILQAMFIQQNALKEMCLILNLPIISELNNKFELIRDLRNDSIGHPNRNNETSNYIIRESIRKWHFELNSFDRNNGFSHRSINLRELIANQQTIVEESLVRIYDYLKKEAKII